MTANELDTKDLLLSRRLEHVTTDPFSFFYVDDYLPADLYQTLLDDYPADETYSYNDEGKMGFRSSEDPEAVARFCREHPAWQRLFDFFSSDAFLFDLRDTFAGPLREARPWSGRKPWVNCNRTDVPNNWLRYQLQEPVLTTFQ
ncbi:MAG: hypothetical protein ACYTAF_14140, partial [Planctomycetota bacterium]